MQLLAADIHAAAAFVFVAVAGDFRIRLLRRERTSGHFFEYRPGDRRAAAPFSHFHFLAR
jgi:hypothetical protein